MSFEALDLALALHSAPRQVEALRARPLPAGVNQVLRIALAQPAALERACQVTGQSPAILIEAARFFIEQLLLARECERDAWRVLGLSPGASKAQLREHHQLLVRLVHPDRSDEWASVYADRVAKAWRRLRDRGGDQPEGDDSAETDHEDERPSPAHGDDADAWSSPALAPAATAAWPQAAPERNAPRAAPRWQGPLLAMTVAGVVVAATWLGFRGGAHDMDSVDLAAAAPEVPASVAITPVIESAAIAAPEWTPPSTAPTPSAAPAAISPTPAPITIAAEPPARVPQLVAATPVAEPVPKPTVKPPARPVAVRPAPARTPPAPVEAPVSVLVSAPAVPVEVKPAATVEARRPSDAETLALLDRYADTYARGDLDGLLALFARPVHADARRVASIAADYTRLFGATREREIRLHNLHWRSHGDRVSGEARFEARYQRNGRSRRDTEHGRIAFELIHDAGQSRLLRLESHRDGGS